MFVALEVHAEGGLYGAQLFIVHNSNIAPDSTEWLKDHGGDLERIATERWAPLLGRPLDTKIAATALFHGLALAFPYDKFIVSYNERERHCPHDLRYSCDCSDRFRPDLRRV